MTQNEEELSPEQRDRLLRELKERLKEIEKLKQSLHVSTSSEEEKKQSPSSDEKNSFTQLREAVEELKVPPLELLIDDPIPIRPKKKVAST